METISAAFPKAQFALVGHEFHGGRSAVAWNEQVFANTTSAHAAAVHFYTIVNTGNINNATLNYTAPALLESAWQFPDEAQKGFINETVPERFKLWVTEFGHRGRRGFDTPEIDGTWLEGLYTGAVLMLTLRTSRVEVLLPYCLVCALDDSPSFTAGPPWGAKVPAPEADQVQWQLTPKGAVPSELMQAISARGGAAAPHAAMRELTFSPDTELRPGKAPGTSQLIGWAFYSNDTVDGAVILHLSPNHTALDLSLCMANASTSELWQLAMRYQPAGPGALLQNMSSVVRKVLPVPTSRVVDVPPYAVLRLDRVE
jgi:hypothetical protein